MPYELGEIILEREFETVDKDGKPGTVKFRLGIPYLDPKPTAYRKWRCPYQIVGLGSESIWAVPGIDAIDALTLSLYVGERSLRHYAQRENIKITFMGDDDLGLYPRIRELTDDEKNDDAGFTGFQEIFEGFFRDHKAKHPGVSKSDDADSSPEQDQ